MSLLTIEHDRGNLHLPRLGLWLDPREPQAGLDKVFVSHAHSDHVAAHREVILSEPTSRLMQTRVPGARLEHILPFHVQRRFPAAASTFGLTLLPAGHVFGSSMALIETDSGSLLYTGDFKLRRGLSAEPCQPRPAQVLIMETTFGRPEYVFPPAAEVIKGIIHFCREALDNDETPVLLGYSLGKSQEILCGLRDAHLPLMLHGTVFQLTTIYAQFGHCFPAYEKYEAGSARGKVLLCPPHVVNSAMLRSLGRTRTAVLTGWAVDPNCRYRFQCDAAFPLSDHADFPDLLEFVRQVQPQRVFTVHGFAADFARTLRNQGVEARALSQNEQLALPLGSEARHWRRFGGLNRNLRFESAGSTEAEGPVRHPFQAFAMACAAISADNRKLEKVRLLSEYLRTLKGEALGWAATWFSGRPFPAAQNKTLQLGWAILRDALCGTSQVEPAAFHQVYLKHSDLGETVFELLKDRPARNGFSVEGVARTFDRLHQARGPLGKTPLLIETLDRCTPLEAKYLVKIITGDLRIGLKEGLVEDALAVAFGRGADEIRNANLLLGDIGQVAVLAVENRLGEAALVPFRPVKFMLASPEETPESAWQRMVERSQSRITHPEAQPRISLWLEDKYDGIRCQLHKVGLRVALYSRDLKEITPSFPELAEVFRNCSSDVVVDGEIIAMRGEQVLPFSELQIRLGRREGDLFMRQEVPIVYMAFDLLWLNGESLLDQALRARRTLLERLVPISGLRLARVTAGASPEDIEVAFATAREHGNEGLMIKDSDSAYTPGRRGLAWLKLKRAFATLDCVVVRAEYGHGRRSKVLSDYTFAVRDERTGALRIIGKAYTGLTDAEIAALTRHFMITAVRQHGRYFEVRPEVVLEIAFDRLQPSTRHDSGLAMRFPRIVRIRRDKTPAEIDTLQTARAIAKDG